MKTGCCDAHPEGEDAWVAHITVDSALVGQKSVGLEGVGVRVGILIRWFNVKIYAKTRALTSSCAIDLRKLVRVGQRINDEATHQTLGMTTDFGGIAYSL